MKAKDLVIGKEYLSNATQSWVTDSFHGFRGTHRVRLLDTKVGTWNIRNGEFMQVSSYRAMRGLRAETLDPTTGEVTGKEIVTLASIRGEWEPTWKLVQENIAIQRKLREQEAAARDALNNRFGAVFHITEKLGLKRFQHVNSRYNNVEVDLDVFHAMAEELEKQGWVFKK